MGCLDYLAKYVSLLLLISINVFLALGGSLILYVAVFVRQTGWVKVIQAYWSPINGITTALICVAGVVMGMAVLGTVAALCRWRAGLYYYSIFALLAMVLFILVGVCGVVLWSKFSGWEDDTYPASRRETDIKAGFDEVYCYAQGVYICNKGSISDALRMFAPALNLTVSAQFENVTGGVNALCNDVLNDHAELVDVCNGCEKARKFQHFSSVLDATNITTGTAPYTECRNVFLGLVSNYFLYLAIGSLIVIVGSVTVVIMSRYLRRHDMYDVYEAF
ncbi:unnamed protein product [Peronospora destructor]|uniref:Tetraspanin n=1 Tax=Peronospora destructor TaxID=86335 RepID=A0AAV0UAY0_9STRA|nr:unnamed protein product [Peronospora destructor]